MVNNTIKQIYLLLIIIVGIISLSVYSTYALFTYEKETGEIVKISTLDELSIDASINEYRRVYVKGDSLTTVDVDINNSVNNMVCYGIWYNVLDGINGVHAYKANNNSLTGGTLEGLANRRVSLVIFNDNKKDAIVNVGVSSSMGEECNLNLSSNKHLITEVYKVVYLNDYLLDTVDEKEIEKASEYKEISDNLIKKESINEIMVSSSFEFIDGVFTLIDPNKIDIADIKEDGLYYFMLDDNNREMYKIDSINGEYINTTKYIGFVESVNGIVKYEDNLEYYGANPDNYIYFDDGEEQFNLFRIVGMFYDKENNKYNVKIVKNDYIGVEKYSLIDNNLFVSDVGNNIYDVLSKYYDNFSLNAKKRIIEYEYKIDYNDETNNELIDIYKYDSKNNYKLNVGLLTLTDYLYASNCNTKKFLEYDMDCNKNNWLYKYENEMLINRLDINDIDIFMIGDTFTTKYDTELNIRPTLYLDSDVMLIKGDGTINNPFIIR